MSENEEIPKLSPKQEIYLKNYESRYGRTLADKMRKVMVKQKLEAEILEGEREIAETDAQIAELEEEADDYWIKIPDNFADPEAVRTLFAAVVEMVIKVQELKINEGFCYVIKKKENGFEIRLESKVVVAPEESKQKIEEKCREFNAFIKKEDERK